jgi:acyl carrier protein
MMVPDEAYKKQDLLFENMTFRDWEIVISPKVHGSWNLHALLPSGMDFFIMASSISGVVGQPTQANYAAANTYQDALARYRLAQGEKAISLDLGMLLTGGLLSQSSVERLSADGTYVPLSESEILAHFEYFCNRNLSIQDIPTQVVSGIVSPSVQCRKPNTSSLPFSHPLWQLELCTSTTSRKLEEDHDKTIDRRTLANAESHTEMSEIVSNALADKFCSLSLNTRAKVSLDEPLHSLGADSLTAVYLRNWVTKEFGVSIAIFDLLGDMSIAALGSFIAKEWRTSQGK